MFYGSGCLPEDRIYSNISKVKRYEVKDEYTRYVIMLTLSKKERLQGKYLCSIFKKLENSATGFGWPFTNFELEWSLSKQPTMRLNGLPN